MFKNIQMKIILLFTVLGILFIASMGGFCIYQLNLTSQEITSGQVETVMQASELLNHQISQIGTTTLILLGVFSLICILIGIFAAKGIVFPMSKLIKSAEKIAAGESVDIKYLSGRNKTQVDDLEKAFSLMTSELKENLNEVSRQKRQIETILLHMTDGIIAFDMDGKIMHINPAATKLLELTPEDDNFDKIFGKYDMMDINLEKIVYLEDWTSTEQKLNVNDKYLNIFFAPYKNEEDRPAGMIVVIQDITGHVKLDNMRTEFVADVSHELKTPITSIMGYADTLLEGDYDKEVQINFLNVIAREARRMARLVKDLLTLSKYDNDEAKWEKSEFDLGELVKKCQQNLQIEINQKKQDCECFVTANVPPVYADRYGIERVVLNILSNSIKYTGEGGTIKIYVGFVYNDAYIKIIDNGIGIPEEDLSRIFERFYRVDKARTREMGGTGLGLSIAKEILDRNEGSIDIKSEAGKGTEVVIRIPAKVQNGK